jgi:hypothetical protein
MESNKLPKLLIIGHGAIQFACLKSKNNKCKNNKFKYEN